MDCRECGATLPADARFCLQCGARVSAPPDAPADPLRETLERAVGFQYRIERLLGRGGMGAVYLAHELALDRDVAIKVLPPEQAGTPQLRDRFRREARTAARLSHPNIVPLYTFGEVDGLMYFVMGYVSGESLAARLHREGRIASETARTLLGDLADALDYAHRHGIVHRDLKPDNILIDGESGAPMLTDFGIAKAPIGDGQLTVAGQILGTAHYMSPEQALGRSDVDARSDLYSLGVLAYEILSGRRPFDAESPMDALTQRLTRDPTPLRAAAPDAANDLVHAVTRCLHRDPASRWPDARSLRAALVAADDDAEDALAARMLRVTTALAGVALAGAGYLAVTGGLAAAARIMVGAAIPLTFLLVGAIVVLKRQTLDAGSILHVALRQPRWWRFWYPKRLRRRGDVWDRLPPRIRRLRIAFAVGCCYLVGLSVPVSLGLVLRSWPQLRLAVSLSTFLILPLLFLERGRTTKYVADTLGVAPIDASRILSTPSWRTTVWQRPPASALLQPGAPPGAGPRRPDTAATQSDTASTTRLAATQDDRANDVTRM
jgi:hypothetical protein